MKCPHCHHNQCSTLRANRHTSGVIMRSRLCGYCKHRFSTYQLPGETHQTIGYLPKEYRVVNQKSILSYAVATTIRQRVAEGETLTTLAKELGIHRSTVGKIVRNVMWTKEPPPRKADGTKVYKVSRCYTARCVHWERKCTMGFTELDGNQCACYTKEEEQ